MCDSVTPHHAMDDEARFNINRKKMLDGLINIKQECPIFGII